MSMFAHVPWVVGIQLIGYSLLRVFVSADIDGLWIAGLAGWVALVVREETQREYQIIETLNPPLRAGLNEWDAFKFWHWNRHSIEETVVSGLAAAAVYGVGAIVL
jgi:hypothetical protein